MLKVTLNNLSCHAQHKYEAALCKDELYAFQQPNSLIRKASVKVINQDHNSQIRLELRLLKAVKCTIEAYAKPVISSISLS